MKTTTEIQQGNGWEYFKKNEKNFGVLSEIIDQLQDIRNRLNGWTEKPYTANDLSVTLTCEGDGTKDMTQETFDIDYVLRSCENSITEQYECIRRENLKIVS